MTRREGEGDEGEEVSKTPEASLDHYREEVNEKYRDSEEKKDADSVGEPREQEESADKTQNSSMGESESGTENSAGSPEGETSDASRMESKDGQKTEGVEQNVHSEASKLENESASDNTGVENDLESIREDLNEKYPDGGEKKDGSGDANGENKAMEKQESAGNSEAEGATESSQGTDSADKAPQLEAQGAAHIGTHERHEAQPSGGETGERNEDPKLEEQSPSEKISGENQPELMRELLNEKYPGDDKDAPEPSEANPTTPPDSETKSEASLPEVNPPVSDGQQTEGADALPTINQTEAPSSNALENPGDNLGSQEDVGWHEPRPTTQASSGQPEIQPKAIGSQVVGDGATDQPEKKSTEIEAVNSAAVPSSSEAQNGKVEPAKSVVNDHSSPEKPPTENGRSGGGRPESLEQPPGATHTPEKNPTMVNLQGSSHQALESVNRESGSESNSGSGRPSDREIKESPIADVFSNGPIQTRAQLAKPESESSDAKGEQAPLVDAHAYYISSREKTRFDIDKAALEGAIGQSLRDGDMYRISGHIEGTSSSFEARLSATKGNYAYVFLEGGAEGVVPGQDYRLRIDQVEKDRTFEVSQGSRGPCIRVYETVLDSLGVSRDRSDGVVQFQVRIGKEGEDRHVYGNYNSATGWMQIPVREIGARPGDRIEIITGRRFDLEDAVADFNRQKPESLKNVSMALDKGKLSLAVDARTFEAKEPQLTSHGAQAVLKMKIADENIKFQLDGKTVTPRFENSERIGGFGMVGDRLHAVSYRSKVESRTDPPAPEKIETMSYAEMREWSKGKIRLLSSNHEIEGEHLLVASDEFRDLISERLKYAESRYRVERGNVGEILAWTMCESLGHQVVKDHPFQTIKLQGSTRDGPDFLIRTSDTKELHYLEVKNQVNQEAAMAKASDEVGGFCVTRPTFGEEQISGAFIVITNWSGETPMVRLLVKKPEVKR